MLGTVERLDGDTYRATFTGKAVLGQEQDGSYLENGEFLDLLDDHRTLHVNQLFPSDFEDSGIEYTITVEARKIPREEVFPQATPEALETRAKIRRMLEPRQSVEG